MKIHLGYSERYSNGSCNFFDEYFEAETYKEALKKAKEIIKHTTQINRAELTDWSDKYNPIMFAEYVSGCVWRYVNQGAWQNEN